MRVAIVTSKHPALDKRLYERQGRFLVAAGVEVHIVAPGSDQGRTADGITLHALGPAAGWVQRLRLHSRIEEHVRRIDPDILHFHDPDLLLSLGANRRQGWPVVVYDAHEDFPLAARSSRGLPLGLAQVVALGVDVVERVLARRVDGVVCAHRRRLAQLRPAGDGLYLPNYPATATFARPASDEGSDRSCIYLGTLTKERGVAMLLEGARLAPDIRWVVVGDFDEERDRLAFANQISGGCLNVEWKRVVPYAEVPGLLARAGVGIMPWRATPQHRWAAQPTKLYEYLAAGLPVVATRLDVTEEVVERTGAGLLHDADDAEHMVACVRRILDDREIAARFRRAGREAFVTTFNYDRLGPRLLAFYERLLNKRQS